MSTFESFREKTGWVRPPDTRGCKDCEIVKVCHAHARTHATHIDTHFCFEGLDFTWASLALGSETLGILFQRLTPDGSLQVVQLRFQQDLVESWWWRGSVGSLQS